VHGYVNPEATLLAFEKTGSTGAGHLCLKNTFFPRLQPDAQNKSISKIKFSAPKQPSNPSV